MKITRFAAAAILAALAAAPVLAADGEARKGADATRILARVDDATLSAGDLAANIELRISLAKLRDRFFRKQNAVHLRSTLIKTAVPYFVRRELLIKYARVGGYEPSEEDRAAYINKTLALYHAKSLDAIAAKLEPAQAELFRTDLEKDLLAYTAEQAMLRTIALNVTEEELDTISKRIEKIHESAVLTNALVYATATNVWKQIEDEDITFEEAVDDYSEADDTSHGGEWNEFTLADLADLGESRTVLDLVQTMETGEVSAPVESDNGLAILKLNGKGMMEQPGKKPIPTYKLARIFFRLPELELPTREELRAEIEKKRTADAFKKKLDAIAASSRIETPGRAGAGGKK
ncbi:MAG: peptidylprolyl isomerase [Kiritimatiellae bacterium]|nr:peptidylprolyl isomerase [Kiritimatiellia bacterium]